MLTLITMRSLAGKGYEIKCNFAIQGLYYSHDTSMLIVDKNIVIQAYLLRLTKNKSTDAIDVQCFYDDRISAVVTIRHKKQIPYLLQLIADRGMLLPD
jgi:hypothetical protein